MTVPRIRLSKEEYEWILSIRAGKKPEIEADISDEESGTDPNEYTKAPKVLSAIHPDTKKVMDIDTYCQYHGLPRDHVSSYKFVSHTGIPFYNIVFRESIEDEIDFVNLKADIAKELVSLKTYKPKITEGSGIAVITISDLHIGAYIDGLINTEDFSIKTVVDALRAITEVANSHNYQKVHVHILGDLIESFTGLNHKNSWKGLGKGMFGAEVVKLTVKILHEEFLGRLNNLQDVKIVGGNHDRTTSDNTEDVQAGAADLIAWGLEMLGHDVEFNPLVITHEVDGLYHILTHGHHFMNKKSTKEICFDYGKQGMFNVLWEGHWHTMMQKMGKSKASKFQDVRDEAHNHVRITARSIFTGNFYSESSGYTTNPGYHFTTNNGKGKPNFFNGSL